MKKKMSVLLSVILCLSLFGCSNTSSRSSAEPTSALGSAPPAESSEPSDDKLIIRLASITSANPDAYEYQAGLLFQEKVAEYSNGSMEVQYYPASQLGNSLEMLEGVSMGTIEMGMSVGFDVYANLDPICQVVGMPFLFKDYDHMRAFLEGDSDAIQEIRNSMIENIDTRIMGYCYRPFRSVVSMSNDIYAPSDMAGMTIRSPESKANMQWIEDMGATPVTISWSELYTSLSTGAAQGAENSITEFHSGNFQDILTSASETNHMAVTLPADL